MVQNVELAKVLYPGWVVVVFVASTVESGTRDLLMSAGAEVRIYDEAEVPGHGALLLRFLPAAESCCAVIFRDADSRLNRREANAVRDWLRSGKKFHIMHDGPHETNAILGGMWGVRAVDGDRPLPDIAGDIRRYSRATSYGCDMDFLKDFLLPKLNRGNTIHHSASMSRRLNDDIEPRDFPPSPYVGFVGQPVNCPRLCTFNLFLERGCPHVLAGAKVTPEVSTALRHQPHLLETVAAYV